MRKLILAICLFCSTNALAQVDANTVMEFCENEEFGYQLGCAFLCGRGRGGRIGIALTA